ncbi:unnamed protein product [Dovyalis caffra]|uniref:F-box domain-containing protein n=1 Tax=Dovyalis caffra TaxID=77055 RepID=A0AAV1SLI2_9ROSI|nr:unnamed protein product [Dovyalis caffra]
MLQQRSTSTVEYPDTGRDVISELPDDVVYSIIECLSLRDAVKTSVLSRRWKRVYSGLPILQFDQVNMFQTNSKCCRHYKEKFVRGVNQFIDSYQGLQIDYFGVSFCLGSEFTDDIDRWISFANRMGATMISICLYCQKSCSRAIGDMHGEQIGGKYVIQGEVLRDRNTNLENLELEGCILGPDVANRLSGLETLGLNNTNLALYDINGMFSWLANLKYLTLSNSTLPMKLCLGPLALLKNLVIADCAGIKEVQLSSNANLHSILYGCIENVVFDLSGAPNLEKFHCNAGKTQLHYIFTHLPKHAPKLRTLSMFTTCDSVKHLPESMTIFQHVTELCIMFDYDPNFDMLKLISILGAFPCLNKLIFAINSGESDQRKLEPAEAMDEQVKKNEIGGYFGSLNQQLLLISYLFKHGISLERMVIEPGEKIYVDTRQSLEKEVCGKAYKRLIELSEEDEASCFSILDCHGLCVSESGGPFESLGFGYFYNENDIFLTYDSAVRVWTSQRLNYARQASFLSRMQHPSKLLKQGSTSAAKISSEGLRAPDLSGKKKD